MFDITALGELLIDFTPYVVSNGTNGIFERNPGGAPANVLVAATRMGCSTALIGMVGDDQFGRFLKDTMEKSGVCTRGLKLTSEAKTTLAFVHLNEAGDRSFSFYRDSGADIMLTAQDVDYELIRNSKIFHFGSLSMTDEPCRSATKSALKHAKENNIVISYDPNLRASLWKSLDDARNAIIEVLEYADILKVSEEELEFITGTADLEEGTKLLYKTGVSVVFVTMGGKGCFYRYGGGFGMVDGFKVDTIDTTGAGDAFLGAALYKILNLGWENINGLDKANFEALVQFANAAGALTTTKKGAIPAMPDLNEVGRLCTR